MIVFSRNSNDKFYSHSQGSLQGFECEQRLLLPHHELHPENKNRNNYNTEPCSVKIVKSDRVLVHIFKNNKTFTLPCNLYLFTYIFSV